MPSFILRKLRSRSTSRQRRDDSEVTSPSARRGSPGGVSNKRTNSSSARSTPKSSPTISSKSTPPKPAIVSPEKRRFLGSRQRPNTNPATKAYGSNYSPTRRQISNGSDVDSMAYSSAASEGSYGVFMTAFDRCPPTFSDDVLDRDIFPSPSGNGNRTNNTWESDHELAVLEDMSNEWTMFSDPSFGAKNNNSMVERDSKSMNVSKNMGALQRDDDGDYRCFPKEKSARLVSPDRNTLPATGNAVAATPASSHAKTAAVTTPNDDLTAWGLTPSEDVALTTAASMNNKESPITKRPTTEQTDDLEDAFGANFFKSGFDDDDGFFEQSNWKSPNKSTYDNSNADVVADNIESNNDPWGQMEGGVNPFDEKKDDDDTGSVIFTNIPLPDPITPTTEPTFTHPLKRQQQRPPGKSSNEVVVSFEDYDHDLIQSPSNSSFSSRPNGERNSSFEKSDRPPAISKSHRRMNSNGSSSKGHRRMNSNGSQGSRRRGGGSVGSNSTAVDQILEHYRQKRLAKQNNGKASSATSSTVSSQPSSCNHRSNPSMDSLSSVPSSAVAAAATAAAPAAAALSVIRGQKRSPTSTPSPSSGPKLVSQSSLPLPTNQSNNGVVDWPDDDGVYNASVPPPPTRNVNNTARVDDLADQFLMANIEATIGPRGSAPDLESMSLTGTSYNRSPRLRNHQASDVQSIDSRTSRNSRYSFRTYELSAKGASGISPESKSVANDLFRLEAQLAEVARQQTLQGNTASSPGEGNFVDDNSLDKNNSSGEVIDGNGCIGAEPVPRLNPIIVVAPPGKLGILLLNNKVGGVPSTPTHVSAVRSESVLAGKVQVGDQLMKVDGEDVSRCNSKQIMAIVAAKSEFERVLEFRCLESSYEPHEWI